jgi:Ca2+-transporting ATPase
MIDPPREDSFTAVQNCRKASIKTIMVTGDYSVTALAVARQLGIGDDEPRAFTGKEVEAITDDELFDKMDEISVFARVSPQHKLRIVQQYVRRGEIVAVTGDGVNDAPALKAAHIGVAMAGGGTDVAKEASDMIVTDDNFASIFSAVQEGRVVYDNIEKVTLFLVSCGLGELLAIFTTLLLGLPIPYIPAQILWLNLVTNGFQDVALAFEPAELDVTKRPPRNPREGIMSKFIIQRTLLMGIILAAGTVYMFISSLNAGMPLERARTVALTTMVFFQLYQAFNCRSETRSIFSMSMMTNPFLFFSVIAAFFAQMAVIYVPSFQWIFRTVPLSLNEWTKIVAVTASIVIAIELDKAIRKKKRNYPQQR